MKMKFFKKSSQVTLAAALLVVGSLASAETLSPMSLNLEKMRKRLFQGALQQNLDLINEAKRQNTVLANIENLDLNKVEVQGKANIGGAGVHLIVNNLFTDSVSLETDPDLFDKAGGDQKIELKNMERRVETAFLRVIGDAKISNVTIYFGEISAAKLLGAYANQDASIVGAAGDEPVVAVRPPGYLRPGSTEKPPTIVLAPVMPAEPKTEPKVEAKVEPQPKQTVVVTPEPTKAEPKIVQEPKPVVVVTPAPTRIEPKTEPKVEAKKREKKSEVKVIRGSSDSTARPTARIIEVPRASRVLSPREQWYAAYCAGQVCVGDTVVNNLGFQGRVVAAHSSLGMVDVDFGFLAGVTRRYAHQLKVIYMGRRP